MRDEKSGRQLVVLDPQTASQVVGILTITDLVRAHAKAAGGSTSPHVAGLARDGLDEVTAGDLAQRAPVVALNTTLKAVLESLVGSPSGAVIVRGDGIGTSGVILLEHVRDFLRDEQLQRMLVAADLVRPAPRASPEDGLAHTSFCRAMPASALSRAGRSSSQ